MVAITQFEMGRISFKIVLGQPRFAIQKLANIATYILQKCIVSLHKILREFLLRMVEVGNFKLLHSALSL